MVHIISLLLVGYKALSYKALTDNEYIVEKDDLKDVSKDILQELDIVSEEEYLLDITRPYHNLLQKMRSLGI